MAKDPAFLFYSNDFTIGTQFFTDEQVGQYMRLLLAQHQHGHLTEKQVIFICKSYDFDILSKFIKDENGLYFNERLESEILRRKSYSESRGNNKKGKNKTIDNDLKDKKGVKSYDNHMETENEIENEYIINKKGVKISKKLIPEISEFMNYTKIYCDGNNLGFENKKRSIEAKYNTWVNDGWKDGNGKPITNWKLKFQNAVGFLANDKPQNFKQNGIQNFATNRPN